MNYIDEINSIMCSSKVSDCLSLSDLYEKSKEIILKQQQLRDLFVKKMNIKLQNFFNKEFYLDRKLEVIMCGFDYDHNELCILLRNTLGMFEKYYFSKINGEFKITESKNDVNRKKLLVIKDELQGLYESYDEIKKIYKIHYSKINVVNSKLLFLDLNLNVIQLYIEKSSLLRPLSVRMYTYSDDYYIDSSKETHEFISENFDKIISSVQVKKKDCPDWIR